MAAAGVLTVEAALQQPGLSEAADPAQRRGCRHRGGDAQARYRHGLALQPCRRQIEKNVPGRIGEDFAWQKAFAITAQLDQSPHQHRFDAAHHCGGRRFGRRQQCQAFGNTAGFDRQRLHGARRASGQVGNAQTGRAGDGARHRGGNHRRRVARQDMAIGGIDQRRIGAGVGDHNNQRQA